MNRDRNTKLDSLFEAVSIIADGSYVYVCDMAQDLSRWSKTAVDYFGLPGEYMYNAGGIWENFIHPEDRESYHRNIDEIFSGQSFGHDMQYRAKTADGTYTTCTCRGVVIKDAEGKPEYFCGAIRNHGVGSYIDSVTGLRSLYACFDDLKAMSGKNIPTLALIIGLNSFSDINDVYGYKFGNRVLQKIAYCIQDKFRPYGTVYRLDGTKFTVISDKLDIPSAGKLYKELQKKFTKDFYVDNEKINVSLNAGVVFTENFNISPETLHSCLKAAYYQSKHSHLGEMVVFDSSCSEDNRQNLEKLNVIRSSVAEECEGFFLCYQPIVNSETEKLKGMEALIRWKSSKYGTVPPVQFIPVLEQDMLFPELGKWIMRQAMIDGKKFLEKYPDMVMNVNLSYAQLEKSDFVTQVFSLLDETGFPAKNLCLEITERCRLLDMDLLKNMFAMLKQRGVKVALDDFGTGFSSLGVLRELPIDTVKIDREFVKNIEESSSDRNTVQFISELAHSFSAEVCVEGVETAEMRDFLRRFRVSSFQGYYYSKPLSADELYKKVTETEVSDK